LILASKLYSIEVPLLETTTTALESRVRQIIERTFRLKPDSTIDYTMGAVPGWDSLGHMRLVVELEKDFTITLPAYALAELTDVRAIARVIEENL